MKTLPLVFLLILSFGCSDSEDDKKGSDNCYRCTITTQVTSTHTSTNQSSTQTHCDLDQAHITQLEQEGTSSTTNGDVTTSITTTCEKQ